MLKRLGQEKTITLEGSRFEAAQVFVRPATPLVFQTIDAAGNRRERLVQPTTVDPAGTQMTVIVPLDAVTGPIGMVGDPQGTAIVLQIVPLVTSVMATGPGVVQVTGKGLIEGGALYRFGTSNVLDGSESTAGVDVLGANDTANVALSALGSGSLTVTTAGGTSAPLPFGALMSLLPAPAPGVLPATDAAPVDLTPDLLQAFVAEAVARFAAAGAKTERLSRVQAFALQISDLPGNYLGLVSTDTIVVDRNAAGWGWFIDATPWEDSEFTFDEFEREMRASTASALDRMDLLTIVMHEVGHVLGLEHNSDQSSSADMMHALMETGVRRLLTESLLDDLLSDSQELTALLDGAGSRGRRHH